ncbi:MAG TPA: PDZ domain-containing protein [Candidatus Sulfotelmatobacter sp.]|jgi:predicted metalloprotease with PDZ domain|nr:PDZ domain-containing protein [Candidatus Sulfotelmatobacter sp.]
MTFAPSVSRQTARGVLAALLALSSLAIAQSAPVSYTISLASPDQHLVEVQIILPAGAAQRELQLPVWNALYQVRNFAQYVNWVRGQNRAGQLLAVRELDKSRWQVQGAEEGAVIEYQIYVDSPGPFGAQLNPHHAFFNFAQILMYPVDSRNTPINVHISHVPDGWKIATPLTPSAAGEFNAPTYDCLVDSPIEIGNFQESTFDEAGARFHVVVDADPADYDMQKIVAALHKIVVSATTWMNDRPFDAYTFIYHFPRGPAGGGMEHAYSTAIDLNAEVMKQSLYPLTAVTSHEFFHLWNVKRIRPQTLEPVDYTKENYTRALWFSEGVTSTAEEIIQFRAGLIDEKQYLTQLGAEITELERRPSHLTQSAEASSLDAWLEGDAYYRRPERSISYYNKGELLGIMLDLAVREASHGQASLREVLQWMNVNYAQKNRFFDDSNGVREAAEAVSHSDLDWFFTKYVAGTDEIPWNDFLRQVGLRVVQVPNTVPDAGFAASRNFDGPMSVGAVTPGSDAERAGLQVGDTILEIQGKPAGQESRQELARLTVGETLTVKVRSRRFGDRELKWKVGARQEISYDVKDLDQITAEQRARRPAWLKGEAQTAATNSGAAGK